MQGINPKGLHLTRRRLLSVGAGGLVSLAAMPALAAPTTWRQREESWGRANGMFERSIALTHLHTNESIKTVYFAEGRYVPEGLHEVNHLMRDYHTDEVKEIDPKLVDLLFELQHKVERNGSFIVYSGYRSPLTNARMRRRSRGVAKNSYHIKGRAIDIHLPGVSSSKLARAAWSMQQGGVGFYRRKSFVHVDTGDVRRWSR